MVEKGLVDFFEKHLGQKSLFRDREVLTLDYKPQSILHREEQKMALAKILLPTLHGSAPLNAFLSGPPGAGKTLITKDVLDNLILASQSCPVPIKPIYVNCRLKGVADTQYRLFTSIVREHFNPNLPVTGLPTDEIYAAFTRAIDTKPQIIILALDEIDQIAGGEEGNDFLYNISRINSELKNAKVALIGISNNDKFLNDLDPRVKSSLSQDKIVFPRYNALQLSDILKQRASAAFAEHALSADLIPKCAAFAARDHGDARKAILLLRIAAELAERAGESQVLVKYLDEAERKIETDGVFEVIKGQPPQYHAAMYAIYSVCSKKTDPIFTGEVYDLYQNLCGKIGMRPLTQRRISDIVGDLESLGIIKVNVISKGRYGRTREISLATAPELTQQVLTTLSDELSLNTAQ